MWLEYKKQVSYIAAHHGLSIDRSTLCITSGRFFLTPHEQSISFSWSETPTVQYSLSTVRMYPLAAWVLRSPVPYHTVILTVYLLMDDLQKRSYSSSGRLPAHAAVPFPSCKHIQKACLNDRPSNESTCYSIFKESGERTVITVSALL